MHPALWVSKTGLSAQDTNMSTISNNLANVNTTGFKRDRAVFQDLLYQINRQPGGLTTQNSELPSGLQLGTGVRVVGTAKQFSQGNLQITEQPLDMAINGRGFLQVQLPDGQIAYTRDGQFQLNANGDVVNPDGYPLEPAINVPENATNITIGKDGTVTAVTDDQAARSTWARLPWWISSIPRACRLSVTTCSRRPMPVAILPKVSPGWRGSAVSSRVPWSRPTWRWSRSW